VVVAVRAQVARRAQPRCGSAELPASPEERGVEPGVSAIR